MKKHHVVCPRLPHTHQVTIRGDGFEFTFSLLEDQTPAQFTAALTKQFGAALSKKLLDRPCQRVEKGSNVTAHVTYYSSLKLSHGEPPT